MSKISSFFCESREEDELAQTNIPLFLGLECEVESVKSLTPNIETFHTTPDGSLRNHGVEFISVPLPITKVIPEFTKLHANLQFYNPEESFSPRTSIHVHVNCLNLDDKVVKDLILFYALYEEFFFMLVNKDRRHNIHCVPLTETHLPGYYGLGLQSLVSRWHKYTALNIKPLTSLGTIEFRHMHGHNDPAILSTWIQTIENLVEAAKNHSLSSESLTTSNIQFWFSQIFGQTKLTVLEPMVESVAFNQILDVKLALM